MSPCKCCHWYWGGCCFSACDSQHGLFRVTHAPDRPWCCEDLSDCKDCACFDVDESTRSCKLCDSCCGTCLWCYCVQPWCFCCPCWGHVCAGWGTAWGENRKRWAVRNGARRVSSDGMQKCPHCGVQYDGTHQCETGLVEVSSKAKKEKSTGKGVTLQEGSGKPGARKGSAIRYDANGFQIQVQEPPASPRANNKGGKAVTQQFDSSFSERSGGGQPMASPRGAPARAAPAAPSCATMERSGEKSGGRCERCKCRVCRCAKPPKGAAAAEAAKDGRAARFAAPPNARKSRRDQRQLSGGTRPNFVRQNSSWFRAETTKQSGFI
jgi:hypothetical protein